jgi:hypothetical protein
VVLESMGRYLLVEIVWTWLRNEEEVEEAMTALSNLGRRNGLNWINHRTEIRSTRITDRSEFHQLAERRAILCWFGSCLVPAYALLFTRKIKKIL